MNYYTEPEYEERPCEVCGEWVDECDCPVCPICEEQGNPECYRTDHFGHGLVKRTGTVEKLRQRIEELVEKRDRAAEVECTDEGMYDNQSDFIWECNLNIRSLERVLERK